MICSAFELRFFEVRSLGLSLSTEALSFFDITVLRPKLPSKFPLEAGGTAIIDRDAQKASEKWHVSWGQKTG